LPSWDGGNTALVATPEIWQLLDANSLGAVVVALTVELTRDGQIKPSLVVLGYGVVQQRALGVARVVQLGLAGGGHEYCANTQYSVALVRARKAQRKASLKQRDREVLKKQQRHLASTIKVVSPLDDGCSAA
jgi:hypothetical protein